jgi:hypothetical protein
MFIDLFIGGTSAVVARTVTSPMELYKVQRQNYFMPNSTLRAVIRKEGLRYLWKGNGINCLRAFPQFSISHAVYEKTKIMLDKNKKIKNEQSVQMISGFMGGIISMVCIYPLENIRTRLSLQTNKNHYRGIYDALKKIPMRQLYNGLGTSVIGFGPFNAINRTAYTYYKKKFEFTDDKYGKDTIINKNKDYYNFIIYLLCGGFSSVTAISVTYPTDIVRKRLQLQGMSQHVPEYNGIIDCVKKVYATDGVKGFYRGLYATYVKLFPTFAIQYYIMDKMNFLKE